MSRFHIVIAFEESNLAKANQTADRLAILAQLGLTRPLCLWFDSPWAEQPALRIVILTSCRGEGFENPEPAPIGGDAAQLVDAKLTANLALWAENKRVDHALIGESAIPKEYWRAGRYKVRSLRVLLSDFVVIRQRLDESESDAKTEPEPKPKPQPPRLEWPYIDRPIRE